MAGDWTPEPYEADDGSVPFTRFIDDLSDFKFVALDTAIDRVLSIRGIDLVRTEWQKALGDGLHEFRVRLAKSLREVFEQAYNIAIQIIELRERHGLTQAELAERCGMDQGDISRIERGATSPTARTLQRIADSLDADVRLVERAS